MSATKFHTHTKQMNKLEINNINKFIRRVNVVLYRNWGTFSPYTEGRTSALKTAVLRRNPLLNTYYSILLPRFPFRYTSQTLARGRFVRLTLVTYKTIIEKEKLLKFARVMKRRWKDKGIQGNQSPACCTGFYKNFQQRYFVGLRSGLLILHMAQRAVYTDTKSSVQYCPNSIIAS